MPQILVTALQAIIARIDGVFDHPALKDYLCSTDHDDDVKDIAESALKAYTHNRSKIRRIDIIGYSGIPMRAVLVPANEALPNHPGAPTESEPLIEFYDCRYPHTPDGQFISRYYLSTLREGNKYVILDLMGGVPDWKIDARTRELVIDWAVYHTL